MGARVTCSAFLSAEAYFPQHLARGVYNRASAYEMKWECRAQALAAREAYCGGSLKGKAPSAAD
eukprot:9173578-Pyramimonas_sp.AAC.1